jgi:hypothetical protein
VRAAVCRCYLQGVWLARVHKMVRVKDHVVHRNDLVLLYYLRGRR